MPSFSFESRCKLSSLHPKLQRLVNNAIKYIDFSILETHRTEEKQKELFEKGATKTMQSKHLPYPSLAVDIAPYPYPDLSEKNPNRLVELEQVYYMAGFIKGLAQGMDIKIRVGSDWNGNNDIRDDKFQDAWHIELTEV